MDKSPKTYIVLGDPLPLARARLGQGHFYDSQKNAKLFIGITLRNQFESKLLEGPLEVEITFFMPIPKTLKGCKPNNFHFKKPDIDNLQKLYLDVMKDIFYQDDSQISLLTSKKIYGKEPRTEIRITRL